MGRGAEAPIITNEEGDRGNKLRDYPQSQSAQREEPLVIERSWLANSERLPRLLNVQDLAEAHPPLSISLPHQHPPLPSGVGRGGVITLSQEVFILCQGVTTLSQFNCRHSPAIISSREDCVDNSSIECNIALSGDAKQTL